MRASKDQELLAFREATEPPDERFFSRGSRDIGPGGSTVHVIPHQLESSVVYNRLW